MTTGYTTLTIEDNGGSVVTVPTQSVQLVIGMSSAGVSYTPISTRSQTTIESTFGYGSILEAAMLTINGGGNNLAGGTCICVKVPPNVKGNTAGVLQKTPVASSTISYTSSVNTVTATAHGFVVGEVIVVTDGTHAGNAGTFVVTSVANANTFTYADASGVNSTTATMVSTGLIYLGLNGVLSAGTTVPTISLDSTNGAWDDYFVQFTVVTGGTIGTAGITFTLSLDANRNTGPTLVLGTATTYVIPNTGITLDFTGTQTLVAGDYIRFATIGPAFSVANIQTAIQSVQSSPFGAVQWGSTHILGRFAGSDGTAVEGYLDTLANGYIYTRAMVDAADALVPLAWGGPGQTEAAWLTSIESSYSAVSARRICANGGYYNMPSPTSAQSPAVPTVFYRRGLAWALAARQVGLPPQRNAGRVKDGSLGSIVLSPLYYTDGFVYHDEFLNPSLGSQRFSCATTRPPNNQGWFILEPFLMSPSGSQYAILPQGQVIDLGSSLFVQGCNQLINDDVRTNPNGTIYVNDALTQQQALLKPIKDDMIQPKIISGAQIVVDQTVDVFSTNSETIGCTLDSRGYVESITASIGLAAPTAG
jgi:hypothetical protein